MRWPRAALVAVVVIAGLAGLLPWNGRPLIAREQELRVVLTARDMARGGSWLIPSYLGEPRLNKPPLMYWMTAGVFRLSGTTQSPFLARLPGAVSGVALVLGIFWFGRRLVGRGPALLGTLVAGTTYLFLYFGRLGETDIPLACFESMSVFALYEGLRCRRPLRWWLGSGLLAAIGFLIKGPAALVLPLAATAAYLVVSPGARRRTRPRLLGLWMAIVILLGAPWYLLVFLSPASAAASGDIGYELGALVKHSAHAAGPFFYLYTLPLALLPWGLLLPWVVTRAWSAARRHASLRFLLAWLVSSIVLMSLIKSKQIHYATLLLAPSALLIGSGLHVVLSRPTSRAAAWMRGYAATFTALLAVAGLVAMALPWRLSGLDRVPCLVGGAVLAAVAVCGAVAWAHRRPVPGFAASFLALLLLSSLHASQLHEVTEPSRLVTTFAAVARTHLTDTSRVYLAGRRLNAMRYYLDTPIERVKDFDAGWQKARKGDLVILASDDRNPVTPRTVSPAPVFSGQQDSVSMALFVKKDELEPPLPPRWNSRQEGQP